TLRGNIAHRAIEATFRDGVRPDLRELAHEESERALDVATLGQVVEEVTEILDRFDESAIAAEIHAAGERAWFELPFAWDWDGIPIHGSIDLVYQDAAGHWHVVDFKTDRIGDGGAAAVAARYTVQVGLYGRALEAATGVRPALGLLFLRTGELVTPGEREVDQALATARERVDAAALVDTDEPEYAEILEDAV
ncbi:MAG: PD-(D/E)XK nuclease family protein, partial [Dehalococcoidia bacterium]